MGKVPADQPLPDSFWIKEGPADIHAILGGADFSAWKQVVLPKKEPSAEEKAAKAAGQPQIVTNSKRAFTLGIQMKALKGKTLSAQAILEGLTSSVAPFDDKTVNTLAAFLPKEDKDNSESTNIAKVGGVADEEELKKRLPDPVDRLVYVMASNPHFPYMIEVRRFKQGLDELAEVYRTNFTKVRDLMATIHDSQALKQMLRVAVHALNQIEVSTHAANPKPNQPAPKLRRFITFKGLGTLSTQKNKLGSLLLAILKAIRPDHPIHRLPETLALAKAYANPEEITSFGNSLVTLNSKLSALDGQQPGDLEEIRKQHFGQLFVNAKAILQEAFARRAEAGAIAKDVARLYSIVKDDENTIHFMLSHLADFLIKMEQAEAVIAREAAAEASRLAREAAKAKQPVRVAKPAAQPALKKSIEFLKRSGSHGSGDNILRGSSFSSLNPARQLDRTRVF